MGDVEDDDRFSGILSIPDHLSTTYFPLTTVSTDHQVELPISGEHESNSIAIVSALKALQEKIRQLEADKKAPLKGLDYMKNVSEDTVDTLINPCTSRNQDEEILSTQKSQARCIHSHSKGVQVNLSSKLYDHTAGFNSLDSGHMNENGISSYKSHYHLNLKDVPFVVGMSTTPSHSVIANFQHMLSLMKIHSPMCYSPGKLVGNETCINLSRIKQSTMTIEELHLLLSNLERKRGNLIFEYQLLASSLKKYEDPMELRKKELKLRSIQLNIGKTSEQLTLIHELILVRRKHKQLGYNGNLFLFMDSPVKVLKKMRQVQRTLQSDDLNWK